MSKKFQLIVLGLLCLITCGVFAAKPVFLIKPIQKAPRVIYAGQTATALYQVTNNTPYSLNNSSVFDLPLGVTHTYGSCPKVFSLFPGASCTVGLQIVANELQHSVFGGPVICNSLQHPMYCSRPPSGDSLYIIKNNNPAPSFTIGGSITGLNTNGLILQNNGSDNLTVPANATSFRFTTPVALGGSYHVTILQQPTGLTCSVSNGNGTNITSNVSNITVTCSTIAYTIGGTITGLTTSGLILQNNGADNLSVAANATTFQFSTPVAQGGSYNATILQQPTHMICAINNASGSNVMSNITNISVPCNVPAYVANSGSSSLSIIDTLTNTLITTIPLTGGFPYGVTLSPNGNLLYITSIADGTVSVFNTSTNALITAILVGATPNGLATTPDGSLLYVANFGSNTVSAINTATNTVIATVPVGTGPNTVAINPAGNAAYITNSADTTVSVIDTSTNIVTATIPVGLAPNGIAINPSGSEAFAANSISNTVSVIDTATNTVVATIPVGNGPAGVAVAPDGSKAYVANGSFSSNSVSVIDTTTNMVVATIPVGFSPAAVAVNASGSEVYVTNGASNDVSVIDTSTNTVIATISVGTQPAGVVIR